jgi:hypothetical protein
MPSLGGPFIPPFCPRSACRFHRSADGWRWIRYGWFTRRAAPHRIPRFRCGHCGHTFSAQTFAADYWLKRPDVFAAAAHRLLACSGYRQIARKPCCAPTTIMRHSARLGRHALLYLWAHRPRGPRREPLVGDGFESFAHSQYSPCHLNLVVGADSHYGYAFTHSELRRKGRMTTDQKGKRAALEQRHGRPDPKAIEHGMVLALALAVPEPVGVLAQRRTRRLPAGAEAPAPAPLPPRAHEQSRGAHGREPALPGQPAGPAAAAQRRRVCIVVQVEIHNADRKRAA